MCIVCCISQVGNSTKMGPRWQRQTRRKVTIQSKETAQQHPWPLKRCWRKTSLIRWKSIRGMVNTSLHPSRNILGLRNTQYGEHRRRPRISGKITIACKRNIYIYIYTNIYIYIYIYWTNILTIHRGNKQRRKKTRSKKTNASTSTDNDTDSLESDTNSADDSSESDSDSDDSDNEDGDTDGSDDDHPGTPGKASDSGDSDKVDETAVDVAVVNKASSHPHNTSTSRSSGNTTASPSPSSSTNSITRSRSSKRRRVTPRSTRHQTRKKTYM